MNTPQSKYYDFEKLLSENNICQAWQASVKSSREPVFIKVPVANSGIAPDQLALTLTTSFAQQRGLSPHHLLVARRRSIESGQLFIEYPYLNPASWRPLTDSLFAKNLECNLLSLSSIVDYLHLMNRVHCDMKLANFMIRDDSDHPVMILADLDLLRPADCPVESQLFGTPGHIAPEIRDNERVFIQSDNYSLGVSLRQFLDRLISSAEGKTAPILALRPALEALIGSLTESDYLARPRLLLDALRSHKLITPERWATAVKDLMASLIITRFRHVGRAQLGTDNAMDHLLRNQCQLMGLHDDLVHSLAAAFACDRRSTLAVFRRYLGKAAVEPHANYWHVSVDDRALTDTYLALEQLARPNNHSAETVFDQVTENAAILLERVKPMIAEGYREKSYLALQNYTTVWGDPVDEPVAVREQMLQEKALLARSLRRLSDAAKHYADLTELAQTPAQRLERILLQIEVGIERRDIEGVDRLLQTAQSIPVEPDTAALRRQVRRQLAWSQYAHGQPEAADSTLRTLMEDCRQTSDWGTYVLTLYNLGVVRMARQGDLRESRADILESFRLAQEHDFGDYCVRIGTTLSLLHVDLAQYDKAIRYGKTAVRLATRPEHIPMLAVLYATISSAYLRQAEFDKAEYWQQRTQSLQMRQPDLSDLYDSLHQMGYVRLNQGRLFEAAEALAQARNVAERHTVSKRLLVRIYLMMAQINLCQGKADLCRHNAHQAQEMFESGTQTVARLQANLHEMEADICYGTANRTPELIENAQKLVAFGSFYYACQTAFYLFLDSSQDAVAAALRVMEAPGNPYAQPAVPLFKAVSTLMTDVEHDAHGSLQYHNQATTWKQALSILMSGKLRFYACLAAFKIAEIYADRSKPMLARKFYQQAKKLAEALHNRIFIEKADQALSRLSQLDAGGSRLIKSMHEISMLLRDLPDYQLVMNNLIRFAVDQSGAERGVLLLKSERSGRLYVVASVNCDDQSLSDIADFSTTVPNVAIEELEPLVIEDAVSDNRTKQYKSVIFHNIMSVVCIPLLDGDKALGALYLDHHSIPALFGQDDIVYIRAIANFITVSLRAAQKYRNLTLHNIELRSRLLQAGVEGEFITRNPYMLDMLDRLREVARTNATVLLLGESGTGKDILAHMIHSYSQRADQPLIKLNCASIQHGLIESEMFGIGRRVATEVDEREGKFGAANGGTLFLDEIADMPIEVQAKVLRAVDEGVFEKVGTNRPIQADIRFIYATNKNLPQLIEDGQFRADLFYRINTITVHLNPLRERVEDIPLLLEHFVKEIAKKAGPAPRLSDPIIDLLKQYHWPGNVRELKNFVERLCILRRGEQVRREDLTEEMRQPRAIERSVQTSKRTEITRDLLKRHLKANDWNRSAVSRELGIPISTLRRWMKKFGLENPE